MENIFQLYRRLGKRTPFIVQRTTSRGCLYLVTRVEPRGKYGEAWGYPLPPGPPIYAKQYPVNPHYGETGVEACVHNPGSYQWRLLPPDLCPERWQDDWKDICRTTWTEQPGDAPE